MFERFTEKARRAIFFARYEASHYGNPQIETEHLLLGLWREDRSLREVLNDAGMDSEVRAAIEERITRGIPFATSVEVPLSSECKKILNFAAEEADRLANRHIGTEHLLLGILHIEDCLAAQIIRARGVNAADFRENLCKAPRPVTSRKPALTILDEFLNGLRWHTSDRLLSFLAKSAQIVDVHGKRWNHEEITRSFKDIFAPYAKKNATFLIEETPIDSADHLVATVLWKNALIASMERVWMHRMTVVMSRQADDWVIVAIQVTPVQP